MFVFALTTISSTVTLLVTGATSAVVAKEPIRTTFLVLVVSFRTVLIVVTLVAAGKTRSVFAEKSAVRTALRMFVFTAGTVSTKVAL